MIKSILLKEWIKTRRIYFALFILAAALTAYAIAMMSRLITLKGVDHLWMIMLLKDNSFVDIIKYVPAICGIGLGVAQMVPEMSQKRLKLTLHLPIPQLRICLIMLAVGIVELLSIFIPQIAAIAIYDAQILPHELVSRVVLSMLPWFFAGFMGYLFTATICLEGVWARRILVALIGIACMTVCYLQPALEAYNGMLAWMIIFVILLFILPLGSIIRFKEGLQ